MLQAFLVYGSLCILQQFIPLLWKEAAGCFFVLNIKKDGFSYYGADFGVQELFHINYYPTLSYA